MSSPMSRSRSLEVMDSDEGKSAAFSMARARRSLESFPSASVPRFLSWRALAFVAAGTVFAVYYHFDRSSVVAKALSVPPLVGLVYDYRKQSHLGWSPCSVLGVALLLHCLGDVIIHQLGVIPSMPAFLAGHFAYCVAFSKGADLSLSNFVHFTTLKQAVMGIVVAYAALMWSILSPQFPLPLKPVLLSYIVAISLMFQLSMFARSKLILVGSALYLISDSLIALARFVFRDSVLVHELDLNLSWPVYFVGQCLITFGALNAFAQVELREPRSASKPGFYTKMAFFIVSFILTFVSVRRVLMELRT